MVAPIIQKVHWFDKPIITFWEKVFAWNKERGTQALMKTQPHLVNLYHWDYRLLWQWKGETHSFWSPLQWIPRWATTSDFGRPQLWKGSVGNRMIVDRHTVCKGICDPAAINQRCSSGGPCTVKFAIAPIGWWGEWQLTRYPDLPGIWGRVPLYFAKVFKNGWQFRIGVRWDDQGGNVTLFSIALKDFDDDLKADWESLQKRAGIPGEPTSNK